jgi:outer membrane murein-binding lipoprotein Lpp
MALRVQRSAALLLAAIVLSGCQGGTFGGGESQSSPNANPAITQTGTQTVRQRIQQLRADQAALNSAIAAQQNQLAQTRSRLSADASAYSSLTNGITSRLQAGTTPGNPNLVNDWNAAQAKLDDVTLGVGTLNSLASQVTTQASVAGYLLENVRATYSVGGAVDEDHRNLRSIESETTRSMQQIDRLIGDLNAQISRENGFLARERTNLAALSYGVNLGRLGNPGTQRVTVTNRRQVPLQ